MSALHAILISSLLGAATLVRADNPFVQTRYTADPATLIYQDRLWAFTSHDNDDATWFNMTDWRLYSTDDMANWQDHGSPAGLRTFAWARQDAWAPGAIERDGKFFLYVPVTPSSGGGMAIGVAVADDIAGPYTDPLGGPLVHNGEFDPTVFIDDDEQAYLYWGNPNLWYVKLNRDMISFSGAPVQVELTPAGFGARRPDVPKEGRPTSYEEGPWLHKHNGTYYMTYGANCCDEDIHYATAPSATGPWTHGGLLMASQGGSFTNHPAVVDYKGKAYFFYHNGALPGGGGFQRSVAVFVSKISNGDYVKVGGVAFGEEGAASFAAVVAAGRHKCERPAELQIRLDGEDGELVGSCEVPADTGGWESWTTVACDVEGATGTHDVFFGFVGSGEGDLFNFDSWEFA
ncbi:hypothetical protein MCOR23_008959 [Pyricularia oryzae]|nr:hypothetical protein MCOR23_008959 [Pyricularia oryzae]